MKNVINLRAELPTLGIMAIPFLYIAFIWGSLPSRIPIHWNLAGEVDRYGSRWEMLLLPVALYGIIYPVLLLIPKIDPKNKLDLMGQKYRQIKMAIMSVLTVASMYLIQVCKTGSFDHGSTMTGLLVGLLFVVFGNFSKTIRPNYFLGIRTPWTLESEAVWKDTHRIGGWFMMLAGLVLVAGSLGLPSEIHVKLLVVTTVIVAIATVLYSYIRYRSIHSEQGT